MGILDVKGVRKSFGGVTAVAEINLEIQEREVCSIIGPNGAGKTTLFNVISGRMPPSSGSIFFNKRDITGVPVHKIVSMGMGRTFQITNIFPLLTAYENIQAAVVKYRKKSLTFFKSVYKIKEIHEDTLQILQDIGLEDKKDMIGGKLPYGDQRRLEVGIAIANHPKLLLLDEPTAGMSPEETRDTVRLVKQLVSEREMTLLFIEHDMDVVFSISDRTFVLHQGRLIAEGRPKEVAENKDVINAYLGE